MKSYKFSSTLELHLKAKNKNEAKKIAHDFYKKNYTELTFARQQKDIRLVYVTTAKELKNFAKEMGI